jgi:hypothetical protein
MSTLCGQFIFSPRDKGGVGITHPIVRFHKNFILNSIKMINIESGHGNLGSLNNLIDAMRELENSSYSYEESLNHYNKWIKFCGILKYLNLSFHHNPSGDIYLINGIDYKIDEIEFETIIRNKLLAELDNRDCFQDCITNYSVDDLSFSFWKNTNLNYFEKKFFMQLQSGVCMNSCFYDSSLCRFCKIQAPLKHSFYECENMGNTVIDNTILTLKKLFSCIPNLNLKFTWEDDVSFKFGTAISPRGAISPLLGKQLRSISNYEILVYKMQRIICYFMIYIKEPPKRISFKKLLS